MLITIRLILDETKLCRKKISGDDVRGEIQPLGLNGLVFFFLSCLLLFQSTRLAEI